ncbi:hypothetical protein [Oribacterium sp. FC2011]|uniref:hypothetical protein n=1 Tax=Oribacterium sp. FC2011 TaxID=1408311 RepID=UPI0004E13F4D|nr:hypothetical protein [Oribacterium sp. FC2011]
MDNLYAIYVIIILVIIVIGLIYDVIKLKDKNKKIIEKAQNDVINAQTYATSSIEAAKAQFNKSLESINNEHREAINKIQHECDI